MKNRSLPIALKNTGKASAGRFLVITKDAHSYVLRFDRGDALMVLFLLMDYAESGDYNLSWDEVFFLIRELCSEFFIGKANPHRRYGAMRYRVY